MTRLFGISLFALVACGPEEVKDPEIVSWTIDPAEMAAGDEVTSTLELMHFALTGHTMDGTATTMTGMSTEGADGHDDGGHDEDGVQVGHVHIYLDDFETNPLLMQASEVETLVIPADATPGEHTLLARLQDEDHLILEPQVTAELMITVLAP